MAKRLTQEEKARREAEKARKKREREEKRRQKEIERGQKMKRKPRWLYWLAREQEAKQREHEQFLNAGRTVIALGRAIRKIQQKITDIFAPTLNKVAEITTPEARLVWSKEPWTAQDRNRYNWGKKQELAELWEQFPDGIGIQDPAEAAKDAKRKTRARQIDRAKAMDNVLDSVIAELREDEENAVRSSLERSYKQVYEDIYKEIQEKRRAIDADKDSQSRIADLKDYTARGNPRRTAPEPQIPQNMPRLGAYGESVVFGAPSQDQVKAVLNYQFDGKDFSKRIWEDTDKLAAELKDIMHAAIINGENSRIVSQKLAQKMGVEFSHAQRLVRTEMNRILNQATLDGMKDAGAEKYQFVAIIDDRTCIKCQRLNGKIYKLSDKKVGQNFPPIHPYCRCTVIARFAWEDEDEDTQDPAREIAIQQTIDAWLDEAAITTQTKAKVQAVVDAQNTDRKAKEQAQQVAIGLQKRAIQQGKGTSKTTPEAENRVKQDAGGDMGSKRNKNQNKASGAIDTEPKTTKELKELEAIAENLYEQQRKSTEDVKKISQSTGWSEEKVAAIKDYIFNQKHKIDDDEEPRRFDANMGMIQSWRRMAKGDPNALEKHDELLLKHEWLEMEIKRDNPTIKHQDAHTLASKTFDYAKAETEFNNVKNKRVSVSERIRRKGSLLSRKQ